MLARYTTTFADFKHAQRLNTRRKPLGLVRWIVFIWLLPVLSVLAAAILLYDMRMRHFAFAPWVAGLLGGFAWIGIAGAIYRPFLYRRLFRQMKNGRPDLALVELELRDDELISRVPGFSEGRFLRTAIQDFAEDDRIALLYLRKNLFLILPKQQLPEADLAAIRAWLATSPHPSSPTTPPLAV